MSDKTFKYDVSVILVSYNTAALLEEAMNALEDASRGLRVQVIFVDNASRDESVALIRQRYASRALIVNERNIGFGRANNQALDVAAGRYVLLLNTDAFVAPDTLALTVSYMDEHQRCGILGVKLVGRDGSLQPSARYFPTPSNLFVARAGLDRFLTGISMVDDMKWDHASVRRCDWVPGCYFLIRKAVIDQIGLFDPRYFLYYEEVDFCFSAKKRGWEVVFFPHTSVVHIGGESAKSEGHLSQGGRQLESLQLESEFLYFRKNHGAVSVWAALLLTALADLVNASKKLLKARPRQSVWEHVEHISLAWTVFRITRAGRQPTR